MRWVFGGRQVALVIGLEVDDGHRLFRRLTEGGDDGVQGLTLTNRGVIYRADGTVDERAVAALLSWSFKRFERVIPERGMVPLWETVK